MLGVGFERIKGFRPNSWSVLTKEMKMIEQKLTVMLAGLIAACIALSGCSIGGAHMGEHAEISGSPDGLRAMFDGLNGIGKTAKESPDAPNQYFANRANYETNVTARTAQPGFLQKLFGNTEKQGS